MATTANNVDLSEAVDRLAQLINNQGYKLLEIESDLRHLDMRVDAIVPTTLNTTVIPTNKVALGAMLVGAAVGTYIGYNEIQRFLEKKARKLQVKMAKDLLDQIEAMQKDGKNEQEIAQELGIGTTELRALRQEARKSGRG